MKPYLDLNTIAIDPAVARRLAPTLAHYYEAIPVAEEGNRVAVAMSHPENRTALAVLEQLLGAEVVALRTQGSAVRAALRQLYPNLVASDDVFAWLPAAWRTGWTNRLEQLLERPVTWLDREQVGLSTLLPLANQAPQRLIVVGPCSVDEQNTLLRELHAPLWFVRGAPAPIRQILFGLRGFASDEVGLSWVVQLLGKQPEPEAGVTLLPLMGKTPWGALTYLEQPSSFHAHIDLSTRRLEPMGHTPTLMLQSGEPRQQLIQALRRQPYDLAVIAAEGQGQFVGQFLADLDALCTWPLGGVLVVKPGQHHT